MTELATIDLPTGVRTSPETVLLESGVEVQVCRTSVHRANGPSSRVILLLDVKGGPLPTPRDLRTLAITMPADSILAGLQSARSGQAAVITLPDSESSAESVAFAAAVCAASWGWDESEQIRVQVNDRSWDIVPAFQDGAWMARIATTAEPGQSRAAGR